MDRLKKTQNLLSTAKQGNESHCWEEKRTQRSQSQEFFHFEGSKGIKSFNTRVNVRLQPEVYGLT